MSIIVNGKAVLDSFDCQHCKNKIFNITLDETCVCKTCGSKYKLIDLKISNQQISAEFEFEGFCCLEQGYINKCNNMCPAPSMFCMIHSDESSIKKTKDSIKIAEDAVERERNKLDLIIKSKKTWIITNLSGIENE